MKVRELALFAAVFFIGSCSIASAAPPDRAWKPRMLTDPAVWSIAMNDGIVKTSASGLHVEIEKGRTWAIAGTSDIVLPFHVRSVTLRVDGIKGPGRWLMRLYGELRAPGAKQNCTVFEGRTKSGEATIALDPRMLSLATGDDEVRHPVMIQLGLEGNAGDFVDFGNLQFTTAQKISAVKPVPGQISLQSIDMMPFVPKPFKVIDWVQKAKQFDQLAFNLKASGEFLPLAWIDNGHVNEPEPTFGLPSYVGDEREKHGGQEGVTCIGAVLGATVAGIDKRKQDYNYVKMCSAFYNTKNGLNLVLDNQNTGSGGSFWYDIFPHIALYALADRYPQETELQSIVKDTSARWAEAVSAMNGNLGHTGYDFGARKAVDNGQWKEPDASGGIAWMEYAAWTQLKEQDRLDAVDACLHFLDTRTVNPYYENMLPYGVITAAKMNAELGRTYNVEKLLNWCFDISDTRGGWAACLGNWNGYDCDGLMGSVDNRGGYAFAMNTFSQAGALVPIVRYDTRYACAIGKWMLNVANNARLFYPGELPADNQSSGFWKGDPQHCIAYEGLRYEWQGKSPCATGDPVAMKWGPKTDIGIYGTAYSGLLAGIVGRTDDPKILMLDCLATDFFRPKAYPTYLLFNPSTTPSNVHIRPKSGPCDLYDAITDRMLNTTAKTTAAVTVPGRHAVLLVYVPRGAKRSVDKAAIRYNGVAVKYFNKND